MTDYYQDSSCPSTDQMLAAIDRNVSEELLSAIIGLALYHEDPMFVRKVGTKLAAHGDANVRGNAILGLGHAARRFGDLDETVVKPIIESGLNDSSEYVRGQAWAAAEDVRHFLGWTIKGVEG